MLAIASLTNCDDNSLPVSWPTANQRGMFLFQSQTSEQKETLSKEVELSWKQQWKYQRELKIYLTFSRYFIRISCMCKKYAFLVESGDIEKGFG
jgi:hypothetical protein